MNRTLGDALVMLFRCERGTALHAIAKSAARRVVTENYYAECRAAQKRRDRWLEIINNDQLDSVSAPEKPAVQP